MVLALFALFRLALWLKKIIYLVVSKKLCMERRSTRNRYHHLSFPVPVSQKLHECSLARARKIFTSARMLGFSLKFPSVKRQHKFHLENKSADNGNNISHMGNWETLGKHAPAMNVSGKMLPRFVQSQVTG